MASIELQNLWKRFDDGTVAVKAVDLSIADGEFMILVGPSGCGKSTTLRMVAGLEQISEGKLLIGDKIVNDLSPKDRDVAMVFQSYALYPHMTVFENMSFSLRLAKADKAEIADRVHRAAATLGLTQYLDRKPKALSGGQRQRVAMGRAIVRNPAAFLMDEPLSNLDAKLRVQMRAEIAGLQNELEVTTVYVTHDQIEAMTMGDRVAVLKRGELMQVDAPQALYDRPDNLFVAGFIGSPAMNLAVGTVGEGTGGRLTVTLGNTTLEVDPAAVDAYPRLRERTGSEVAVGIRPEHFVRSGAASAGSRAWTEREVTLVELLGSEAYVHFRTTASPVITDDVREALDDQDAFDNLVREGREGGQVFVARWEPHDAPKVGDRISVGVRTDALHFFDLADGAALR